jgi:hypothetical protein
MLIVFKPSGNTKASMEMTLRIERLLQDCPNAITLKVKSDSAETSVPFINQISEAKKGEEIVVAGHGCCYSLLANLFRLWDRGVFFKIKKPYFLLSGHSYDATIDTIETLFGKRIWEDTYGD